MLQPNKSLSAKWLRFPEPAVNIYTNEAESRTGRCIKRTDGMSLPTLQSKLHCVSNPLSVKQQNKI